MEALAGYSLLKTLSEPCKEAARLWVVCRSLFMSLALPLMAVPISWKERPNIPHLELSFSMSLVKVLNIIL